MRHYLDVKMPKMKINKKKLDKAIIRAKKLIVGMVNKKDKDMIGLIEKHNKEICLVVANFKCQKCKNKKDLQSHHLIMRKAKDFMDFWRYSSCRYYWSNSIILCIKCHNQYHSFLGKDNGEERMCIDEKEVERIKRKFSK